MKKASLLVLLLIIGFQVVVLGIQTFNSDELQLVNTPTQNTDFGRKPSSLEK